MHETIFQEKDRPWKQKGTAKKTKAAAELFKSVVRMEALDQFEASQLKRNSRQYRK